MKQHEHEALIRLIEVAKVPTGQGLRCADFLLAWWNAATCGGFDLTDFWAVDTSLCQDMLVVVQLVAREQSYPDTLGYKRHFDALIRTWRPHLIRQDEGPR